MSDYMDRAVEAAAQAEYDTRTEAIDKVLAQPSPVGEEGT